MKGIISRDMKAWVSRLIYPSLGVFTTLSACSVFLMLRFTSFSSAKDIGTEPYPLCPLHWLGRFHLMCKLCVFWTPSLWTCNPPVHHPSLFIRQKKDLSLTLPLSLYIITVYETLFVTYSRHKFRLPLSIHVMAKNLTHLWLRHHIQELLIGRKGHVSQDWSVVDHLYGFVLQSTVGGTINANLKGKIPEGYSTINMFLQYKYERTA